MLTAPRPMTTNTDLPYTRFDDDAPRPLPRGQWAMLVLLSLGIASVIVTARSPTRHTPAFLLAAMQEATSNSTHLLGSSYSARPCARCCLTCLAVSLDSDNQCAGRWIDRFHRGAGCHSRSRSSVLPRRALLLWLRVGGPTDAIWVCPSLRRRAGRKQGAQSIRPTRTTKG